LILREEWQCLADGNQCGDESIACIAGVGQLVGDIEHGVAGIEGEIEESHRCDEIHRGGETEGAAYTGFVG